ncbi:MAG TPA: hypothetical protein GXX40_03155 [Firmicutes bacterium]|nr:hypothetical protein [Bacillota bacterium]
MPSVFLSPRRKLSMRFVTIGLVLTSFLVQPIYSFAAASPNLPKGLTPLPPEEIVKPSQQVSFRFLSPSRSSTNSRKNLGSKSSIDVPNLPATVVVWNTKHQWVQHPVRLALAMGGSEILLQTNFVPEEGWTSGETHAAALFLHPRPTMLGPEYDIITRLLPGNHVELALRGDTPLPKKLSGSLKSLRVGDIVRLEGQQIVSRYYQSRSCLVTWFKVGPSEGVPAKISLNGPETLSSSAGTPVDISLSVADAYGTPLTNAIPVVDVTEMGLRQPNSLKVMGPTQREGSQSLFYSISDTEAEEAELRFSLTGPNDKALSASIKLRFLPAPATAITLRAQPQICPWQNPCRVEGEVLDAFGNPVSVNLQLSAIGTVENVQIPSGISSDPTGQWATHITSPRPQLVTLACSTDKGIVSPKVYVQFVNQGENGSYSLELKVPSDSGVNGPVSLTAPDRLQSSPGAATPDHWVYLSDTNGIIGSSRVSQDGSWSVSSSRPLVPGEKLTLTLSPIEIQPRSESQIVFEGRIGWGQVEDDGVRYFNIPRECDVTFEYYSIEETNVDYHNSNLYFLVYPPGDTTFRKYAPAGKYVLHLPAGDCKIILSTRLGVSTARMVVTFPK